MRRVKVTYRPQAISDLQGIYRIIAEASQSDMVTSGFVQRIMARCRKIGDVPNGGRPRDDLEIVFFDSDQWLASTVGIEFLQMDLRTK
ncbi:type II toxin-antitoxin system RelE/ParE family toxin [Mesorhizobium abyssinicae]|uniref:type II toxin-antitoxin system RelE/ParE family toxin n=1 Tax=Mesorhizobium abyssinicae TaxID=1209958 RepID=UPI003397743C